MLREQLRPAWRDLARAFSGVVKPSTTEGCDCSFCIPAERILALLEVDPELLTATSDVRVYVQNALGTVGTPEDLTFLLPALLRLWAEQLWKNDFNDSYREHFWNLLRRGEFLRSGLPEDLNRAATTFLRSVLLARLAEAGPLQRIKHQGGPHLWMEDLSGFASATDGLEALWKEWWALSSPGHAAAAVTFASCLIFEPDNNPVFHRWTPLGGGGAPSIFTGDANWLPGWTTLNLSFLRGTLNSGYLAEALARSLERFQEENERRLAEAVLDALRGDPTGVDSRIRALLAP